MFWKVDITDIADAKYDERVVCFMDILGFREFVKKNKGQKSLNSIRDLLFNIHPDILCPEEQVDEDIFRNLAEEYGARVVQFSDCIFISMEEISYDSLDWLYSLILNVTLNMIEGGMMCRGAITIGDIYHKHKDGSLLFGPAVIDAYEMESKCAIFPRVIVTNVLEQRQKNLRPRSKSRTKDKRTLLVKYLSRDSDDFLYVDYFQKMYDFTRAPKSTKIHLQHVRKHIVTQLKEANSPSVEQKMNWAKRKFNNYLRKIITYIEDSDNTDFDRLKRVKRELYDLEII